MGNVTTTTALDPPYQRTAAEVAHDLGTDLDQGLGSGEAAARLMRQGPNVLPAARRRGPVLRFALQFHSPLIYVLLVSAVITAVLGEHVDASVILGVVIVNAIVGFVQEARAERALTALAALTRTVATAVRDGRPARVPSDDLVPGDVVVLEAGDKIPADLRLVRVAELKVDESALTGESAPVTKAPDPLGRPRWPIAATWPIPGRSPPTAPGPASSPPPARTPRSAWCTGWSTRRPPSRRR